MSATADNGVNFRGDVSGVGVIAEQCQYLSVHSRRGTGDAAGVLLGGCILGVDSWLGEEVKFITYNFHLGDLLPVLV